MKLLLSVLLLFVSNNSFSQDLGESPTGSCYSRIRGQLDGDESIESIDMFSHRMITIHYKDGGRATIGIHPENYPDGDVDISEVDCETPARDWVEVTDQEVSQLFLYEEISVMSDYDSINARTGRHLDYHLVDGHYIPNYINKRTAPELCTIINEGRRVLNLAEGQMARMPEEMWGGFFSVQVARWFDGLFR